jgi:hypothetical protein
MKKGKDMKTRLFLSLMLLVPLLFFTTTYPGFGQGTLKTPNPDLIKKPPISVAPQPSLPRPPVELPCLVAENLQFQPANPKPGDLATFSFNIKNIGPGPAGPVAVQIYSPPKPFQVASQVTPKLAPGQSQAYAFKARLNDDSMGIHSISVDYNLYAPTIKMAPGCPPAPYTVPSTIKVAITPDKANKPDLIIDSVSVSPANPTRDGMIVFTIQVKNIGPKTSTAGSLFAVLNNVSSLDMPKLFDTDASSGKAIPPLSMGQVHTIQLKRINSRILLAPGNRYLYMVASQDQNPMDEVDRSNNSKKYYFQVSEEIESSIIKPKPELKMFPDTGPQRTEPPVR